MSGKLRLSLNRPARLLEPKIGSAPEGPRPAPEAQGAAPATGGKAPGTAAVPEAIDGSAPRAPSVAAVAAMIRLRHPAPSDERQRAAYGARPGGARGPKRTWRSRGLKEAGSSPLSQNGTRDRSDAYTTVNMICTRAVYDFLLSPIPYPPTLSRLLEAGAESVMKQLQFAYLDACALFL